MNEAQLAVLVEEHVTAITSGQRTLPQCLADYPELAHTLAPLLAIALELSDPPAAPDPRRKQAARASFLDALRRSAPEAALDTGAADQPDGPPVAPAEPKWPEGDAGHDGPAVLTFPFVGDAARPSLRRNKKLAGKGH